MPRITKLSQILDDSKIQKGTWKLNKDHSLSFKEEGAKKMIKLDSSLISADAGLLLFSYTVQQEEGKVTTRMAALSGKWTLAKNNKIAFEMQRSGGVKNVLAFNGHWQINKQNEIFYTYTENNLKTKTNRTQELLFKGFWDITDKHRLTYALRGDTSNAFEFKGAFRRGPVDAKDGELCYELNVGIKGKRKIRTIVLSGEWTVSKDLKLDFQIEYSDGEQRKISFGGTYRIDDKHTVTVDLNRATGKPLGIELVLTRDIWGKDGQIFVRLRKTIEESRVEAGLKVRW